MPFALGVVAGDSNDCHAALEAWGGMEMDIGGLALEAASLLSTLSFSFCLKASSRLISSSISLAKRYRSIHLPMFTSRTVSDCYKVKRAQEGSHRTPLIFPKLHMLVHDQLIGVRFGIEAVEGLESDGEVAGADVDRAPWRDSLELVDLGFHILEMSLPKAFYGLALGCD